MMWVAFYSVCKNMSCRNFVFFFFNDTATTEIERAMSGVPVTLRAEVAATRLPIEDILALAPGSVIRLGARAEHGVSLFA